MIMLILIIIIRINIMKFINFYLQVKSQTEQKLFQVKKGYGENDYIINAFVVAVELIRNELLKNENDINVYTVKPFIVETQE